MLLYNFKFLKFVSVNINRVVLFFEIGSRLKNKKLLIFSIFQTQRKNSLIAKTLGNLSK